MKRTYFGIEYRSQLQQDEEEQWFGDENIGEEECYHGPRAYGVTKQEYAHAVLVCAERVKKGLWYV